LDHTGLCLLCWQWVCNVAAEANTDSTISSRASLYLMKPLLLNKTWQNVDKTLKHCGNCTKRGHDVVLPLLKIKQKTAGAEPPSNAVSQQGWQFSFHTTLLLSRHSPPIHASHTCTKRRLCATSHNQSLCNQSTKTHQTTTNLPHCFWEPEHQPS
jgi:hypothetical protein